MFERGLLSGCEIVLPFVDELETDHLDAEWSTLPEEFQVVVRQYLRDHPPAAMPRYFIIGCPTEEEIERLTEVRKRKAAVLVDYLENLGALKNV
jgi:hypothetical protein